MIRKAVPGDIPAVAAIYERIHDREEAGAGTTGWKRGVYPTEATAREALAADVLAICKRHRVPCVLHSFLDVAKRLGVKQIQLPLWKLEEAAADANRPLDSFSRIGASVHSVEDARRAGQLGASYLIAGHIFATGCKPGIPPRGLAFLREVCHAASVPVYAIGGISLDSEQMQSVLSCGAAGVCIMSGMMRL